MDGDGKLRLAAEASEDGSWVQLHVSDGGIGMQAGTISKVFTPFFSLHRAGRGRGMGLARARRYTENNGSSIQITSTSGQGTTVSIELPRANDLSEK